LKNRKFSKEKIDCDDRLRKHNLTNKIVINIILDNLKC